MNNYYQCPRVYGGPSIFIAGGITGTDDWQDNFSKKLLQLDQLNVVNPRRKNFNNLDNKMSIEQIQWEYRQLRRTDSTMFWFTPETLCPITLLELGDQLNQAGRDLFIGVHPSYQRFLDVNIQVKLRRPEQFIYYSLDSMYDDIKRWYNNFIQRKESC